MPLTSRQREAIINASRWDLGLFFGAFVVGLLLYFSLTLLGAPQLVITASMVGVMVVYAGSVWAVPRLRIRLDQAGDNSYYLGLLFTLVSMAVALYKYGSSDPVSVNGGEGDGIEAIIGNFGIALATTITGIFLRILLHQMRVDPSDIERVTRLELSESAQRVKGKLDEVSLAMGRFMVESQQRASDTVRRVEEDVADRLARFNDLLRQQEKTASDEFAERARQTQLLLADAGASISQLTRDAVQSLEGMRALESTPKRFAAQLAASAEHVDRLANAVATAGHQLSDIAGTGESAMSRVSGLASAMADVIARLERARELGDRAQVESAQRLNAEHVALREALLGATESTIGALEAVSRSAAAARKEHEELQQLVLSSARSAEQAQRNAKVVLESLITMTDGLVTQVSRVS